jgi:hypothetical protein
MAQFGFGGGLARRRAALHAIRALSAVIPTPCQSLPGIGRRGVLLTVFARLPGGVVRCNVSSWYVAPNYRPYGP